MREYLVNGIRQAPKWEPECCNDSGMVGPAHGELCTQLPRPKFRTEQGRTILGFVWRQYMPYTIAVRASE